VLTFGKKWYKDALNYPHRSVFKPHEDAKTLDMGEGDDEETRRRRRSNEEEQSEADLVEGNKDEK
jgi:hypothetical protein